MRDKSSDLVRPRVSSGWRGDLTTPGGLPLDQICTTQGVIPQSWAAQYDTWLLLKMTLKGVVFSFCFIYFVLFYFVLFYFTLFYFTLFYFILFCFILFYFVLFCSILFYSILFYSILFYSILFYST